MRQPTESQHRAHALDRNPLEYLFDDFLGREAVPRVLDNGLYRHAGSFDNPVSRHLAGCSLDIWGFRPSHTRFAFATPAVFAARRL